MQVTLAEPTATMQVLGHFRNVLHGARSERRISAAVAGIAPAVEPRGTGTCQVLGVSRAAVGRAFSRMPRFAAQEPDPRVRGNDGERWRFPCHGAGRAWARCRLSWRDGDPTGASARAHRRQGMALRLCLFANHVAAASLCRASGVPGCCGTAPQGASSEAASSGPASSGPASSSPAAAAALAASLCSSSWGERPRIRASFAFSAPDRSA